MNDKDNKISKKVALYVVTLGIKKVFDDETSEDVVKKNIEFTKRSIKPYTKAVRNTAEAKKVYEGMIDESTLDNKYLSVNCKDMYSTNVLEKELIGKDKKNDKRVVGANLTLYFGDKVEFESIVKPQPKNLAEKIEEEGDDII